MYIMLNLNHGAKNSADICREANYDTACIGILSSSLKNQYVRDGYADAGLIPFPHLSPVTLCEIARGINRHFHAIRTTDHEH
ncbi:hypothetical protein [Yersinia pseudotuberculosis]|uniref:hypothetical protein n=1 Tax=Yersinia pseudotuberculosis TaxID=633 RepID=UPI001A9F5DE5|nr:hypothetical protein [Yersinia pseudotuberculosis]